MYTNDANATVSHLLLPDGGPGLAESSGSGRELDGKFIAIGVGAEVSTFLKSPTSLVQESFAFIWIKRIDGDIGVPRVSPVIGGDEGIHHQFRAIRFTDQWVD